MADKVFIRNIPDELWRKLKGHSALQGKTVSQAVREAIMLWLSRVEERDTREVNWEGITGLGRSGMSDVSEEHDDYLSSFRLGRRRKK